MVVVRVLLQITHALLECISSFQLADLLALEVGLTGCLLPHIVEGRWLLTSSLVRFYFVSERAVSAIGCPAPFLLMQRRRLLIYTLSIKVLIAVEGAAFLRSLRSGLAESAVLLAWVDEVIGYSIDVETAGSFAQT